jgi:hypothetical protein
MRGFKMKLLVLQETDWIKRGQHQHHHLMDRMGEVQYYDFR